MSQETAWDLLVKPQNFSYWHSDVAGGRWRSGKVTTSATLVFTKTFAKRKLLILEANAPSRLAIMGPNGQLFIELIRIGRMKTTLTARVTGLLTVRRIKKRFVRFFAGHAQQE